jgi:hypothetical protein
MGLLLSVLVVCVGVLEVLACVRHFQDGYLPLWTPHCAVTSGYTVSYEHWRKKPSGSYEFKSFDDVNGALNRIEDQSLENYFETSSNVQNGFTGKHVEKVEESNYPTTDCYCQQSKRGTGDSSSPSIDDHKKEVIGCHNIPDILASTLEFDEGELKVNTEDIRNSIPPNNTASDVPPAEYDKKSEKSEEAFPAELTSDVENEKYPVDITAQCDVLISCAQTESVVPLSDSTLEEKCSLVTGNEKCSTSTKEIDIQNEVRPLNAGDELHTSPCGLISEGNSEGDFSDGILSGKHPTHHDYMADAPLIAVGEPDRQVPMSEVEPNIPVSCFMTQPLSKTFTELDHIPRTETEPQIPASDLLVDRTSSTVLELQSQIATTKPESNIPSSHLTVQEERTIFGFAVDKPFSTDGKTCNTQQDSTVSSNQNESAVPADLKSEQSSQNSFISSVLNEDTSITPVKANTQQNVSISSERIESELTDIVNEKQVALPELVDAGKELPDSNILTEFETCISVESAVQKLETDVHKGTGASKSQVENSASTYGTEPITTIEQGLDVLKQENFENVTFEEHPIKEANLDLEEDETGTQHDVLMPRIGPEPSSPDLQNEKHISITSGDAEQDVSESRLDSQTTLTDPVTSLDEGTPHEDDSGFPGSGDLTQPDVHKESSDLHTSSITSVTPLTLDTSVDSLVSHSPLTIDTSLETSASVTPLPTDHQPSLSPPKVPSTPKKSKADISWPTFFPGTPVIKRPSVSFATPESMFASEDQDLLRQYVEDSCSDTSCVEVTDDSTPTKSGIMTANSSEGKLLLLTGTPERSDSFEEEPEHIVFREKSPTNIVAGNDFSRKELKLQRRRSYKQKRYNSATEIRTREEQAEDSSFSENIPPVTRAISVQEPKKHFKKPAKASSFEDALLRDIKTDEKGDAGMGNITGDTVDVSIPEGREAESEETQQQEQEDTETVTGETKEINDATDFLTDSSERNEPKLDESKPHEEEKLNGRKEATEVQKDDKDDEDCSVSEEQSSSQQEPATKEAFWVSSEDGTR